MMLLNKQKEIPMGLIDVRRAIISAVTGFIVTLLLYMVFSLLALISLVPEGAVRPLALIITLVSTFFAGYLTSRNVSMYGLLNGLATGLFYFLITYIFSVILNLRFSFNSQLFLTFLTVVIGSALGGIVGINQRSARYRRMRRRYRR